MKWIHNRFYRYFGTAKQDVSDTEKQILFREYEICLKSIESQKDIFLKISSLIITIFSAVISIIFFIYREKIIIEDIWRLLFSLMALWFICFLLIKYLLEQNTKIFYSISKVIIIRRVLGINFNYFNPIIPHDMAEGANDPFDLKSFPGWFSIQILPLIFISFTGSIVAWQIMHLQKIYRDDLLIWGVSAGFFISFIGVIRRFSFNHYERISLVFGKLLFGKILKIKLENNFGWPLYRSGLSIKESQRLKIDLNKFKKILIHIEDKQFLYHKGISLKAIIRALRDQCLRNKRVKSGGSTITQQLIRTLFVIEYNKKWRRKLVELFLSRFWIEKLYNKNEILDLYLCSVRYEKKVIGIIDAIKHFFPQKFNKAHKKFDEITPSEVFFLIERIANRHSSLLLRRVLSLIRSCRDADLISNENIYEIKDLYISMKKENKINCDNESLKKLENEIQKQYSNS